MYCGNVDGEFLPPVVVYKSQNLYDGWTKEGPAGTLEDNAVSGWFDSHCFGRWFNNVSLPHAADKPGLKVLIGNNLASHFTPEMIESSIANNIEFTGTLPFFYHFSLATISAFTKQSPVLQWRSNSSEKLGCAEWQDTSLPQNLLCILQVSRQNAVLYDAASSKGAIFHT